MRMSAIDDLSNQLVAAKTVILPEIEGLLDLLKLEISDDSRLAIVAIFQSFEHRRRLLESALAALSALSSDGYPALPPHEVSQVVLADLKRNLASIREAILQVTPEAITVTITAGTPTEKP